MDRRRRRRRRRARAFASGPSRTSGSTRRCRSTSPSCRSATSPRRCATTAIRRSTTGCSTAGWRCSARATPRCGRSRACSPSLALPLIWFAGKRVGGRTVGWLARRAARPEPVGLPLRDRGPDVLAHRCAWRWRPTFCVTKALEDDALVVARRRRARHRRARAHPLLGAVPRRGRRSCSLALRLRSRSTRRSAARVLGAMAIGVPRVRALAAVVRVPSRAHRLTLGEAHPPIDDPHDHRERPRRSRRRRDRSSAWCSRCWCCSPCSPSPASRCHLDLDLAHRAAGAHRARARRSDGRVRRPRRSSSRAARTSRGTPRCSCRSSCWPRRSASRASSPTGCDSRSSVCSSSVACSVAIAT